MQYKSITEEQWRAVQDAPGHTSDIRVRCQRIAKRLKDVFDVPSAMHASGLSVSIIDSDDIIAELETPMGIGRLRLSWTVVDGDIAGLLNVERKNMSGEQESEWEQVWGFVVPRDGNPYAGNGEGKQQILFDRQLGDHLENSLFAAGMSMLYALAVGPQTE